MPANMTEKPYVLHFITPQKNPSPFDANMAYDAGYDAIVPYVDVTVSEIPGLIQDAMFSRGPRGVWRTGIFIGGRDIETAMSMLNETRRIMFDPFRMSVFADPSGAFTTSAAVMVKVNEALRKEFQSTLEGKKVVVFGTGPVGVCTAILSARQKANVTLVGYQDSTQVDNAQIYCEKEFGVDVRTLVANDEAIRASAIADADVIVCCVAAGVRVLSAASLVQASSLKVVVDINAVPPTGVEGVGSFDDIKAIPGHSGAYGIGAMAVGNIKYQLQQTMFQMMINAEHPVSFDFIAGFDIAKKKFL